MDKSTIGKTISPKGWRYCDQPGTSCYYDMRNLCVNCGRRKGWRQALKQVIGKSRKD